MISRWIARAAMLATLVYYTILGLSPWLYASQGDFGLLQDMLEMPTSITSVPATTIVAGFLVSLLMILSLAYGFLSLHRLFSITEHGDFKSVGSALHKIAVGLFGFWFFYNMLTGAILYLVQKTIVPESPAPWQWDPLDTDVVILIVAIALFAVSKTMARASAVADENAKFI